MARFRCLTCGGEYDDVSPDGVRYYHTCPPITDPDTGRTTELEDKRDENILVDIYGVRLGIRSEGKGREMIE